MIVLLFVPFTVPSASSLLGGRDDIFHLKFSTGRSILQAQQDCPVNNETLNYSNLTSQCKPPYEAQPCCTALKELAWPFVEQFNVSGNNCATRLYKYFDFLNYPDGCEYMYRDQERTSLEEPSNFSSLDGQLHQIVSTVVSFFSFSIPRVTLVFIYEYTQMYAPKGLTI
ncbi:hypothetical protein LIER_09578 [Lithospermum erythrorhizon]|uniref:GPI-anchored protein LLG1-like domain-containing protein n=1 Tax=Lithospermum erythrorhizon TaxID=34254 RepID=A0AAV3PG42_LITER